MKKLEQVEEDKCLVSFLMKDDESERDSHEESHSHCLCVFVNVGQKQKDNKAKTEGGLMGSRTSNNMIIMLDIIIRSLYSGGKYRKIILISNIF